MNYDLTFIVLLLGSLYEPEEAAGEFKCIAHPSKAHAWWASEMTDYAADMNVMLAYLKCMDNWQDDASFPSLAAAGALGVQGACAGLSAPAFGNDAVALPPA